MADYYKSLATNSIRRLWRQRWSPEKGDAAREEIRYWVSTIRSVSGVSL